jgi:exosortase
MCSLECMHGECQIPTTSLQSCRIAKHYVSRKFTRNTAHCMQSSSRSGKYFSLPRHGLYHFGVPLRFRSRQNGLCRPAHQLHTCRFVKYNLLQMPTNSTDIELEPAASLPGMPTRRFGGASALRTAWAPYAAIAILLAVIYYRVATKIVYDWYTIPDYSHGFLVPFFAIFLIWDKRKVLRQIPVQQSWKGIPLVVASICILILGVYGVDLFTARISFVFLVAGLIWTLLGWKMLRELRFPLLVLVLAIPFPTILFNKITFPLQLFASRLASNILPVLGVPVLLEGNVIQLPVMKLEVAEACSGIRSLMSLFTLAIFYGYFLERTTKRRILLALASIPIAVAANALRIVGTGLCVQYWDPVKALGFFHEFSGWVMFVISLGCLYLVHRFMRLFSPAKAQVI